MYTQVKTVSGELLSETNSRFIRDAVHNGLDEVTIHGQIVYILGIKKTDNIKIITVAF